MGLCDNLPPIKRKILDFVCFRLCLKKIKIKRQSFFTLKKTTTLWNNKLSQPNSMQCLTVLCTMRRPFAFGTDMYAYIYCSNTNLSVLQLRREDKTGTHKLVYVYAIRKRSPHWTQYRQTFHNIWLSFVKKKLVGSFEYTI